MIGVRKWWSRVQMANIIKRLNWLCYLRVTVACLRCIRCDTFMCMQMGARDRDIK